MALYPSGESEGFFVATNHISSKGGKSMMNKKKYAAVVALKGKGSANVQVGTTESGKSTLDEALARNEEVQMMLETREAHGKGSTNEAEIIVTDCKDIPENELQIIGKIIRIAQGDCNDDNKLLGSVVYSGIKDYVKKPNIEAFRNKVRKAFENAILHPANESLEYKLKDINDNDKQELLEILYSIPVEDLEVVFEEVQARNPRKGQKGFHIFVDLVSKKDTFSEIIKRFWDKVLEIINREAADLKRKIENEDGLIDTDAEGNSTFFMSFQLKDKEKEVFNLLLKSEDASKEYLLSDLSIIYRGADKLFEQDTNEYLVVSEHDGIKVRCIRLIDTQGLFHATGATVADEADRIIDIMSRYHASTLVLTINSMVSDTVKDGYEAIRFMLQEANRDIKVIIVFTHWDQYLKDNGQVSDNVPRSKFGNRTIIDWDSSFEVAKKEQKKYEEQLREALKFNTNKRKPSIVGTHYAAVLSDGESKMENLLYDKNYTYPNAVVGIVKNIISELAKNGKKVRVSGDITEAIRFEYNDTEKKDISNIYNNLVLDCMNGNVAKRLYASTVRACNRKWRYAGTYHTSHVEANDYGFENIETKFVQGIRNLVMLYKDKIIVDADNYVVSERDTDAFMKGLHEFLALNQNWGREAAMKIGEEAYSEGFNKKNTFAYQYVRFADMLEYTRDNYFTAPSMVMNDKLLEVMKAALKKCVGEYIDENCILVY